MEKATGLKVLPKNLLPLDPSGTHTQIKCLSASYFINVKILRKTQALKGSLGSFFPLSNLPAG